MNKDINTLIKPSVNKHIVGIGAVCVSAEKAVMISYAIGSCIALCLYDCSTGIGAMAHILLPSQSFSGHSASMSGQNVLTKYADHALFEAVEKMCALGADKKRIRAAIVGGAEMFPHGSTKTLNIGEMNIASVTAELKKHGIPLEYSVTGGKKSRTVSYAIPGKSFEKQITIKSPHF